MNTEEPNQDVSSGDPGRESRESWSEWFEDNPDKKSPERVRKSSTTDQQLRAFSDFHLFHPQQRRQIGRWICGRSYLDLLTIGVVIAWIGEGAMLFFPRIGDHWGGPLWLFIAPASLWSVIFSWHWTSEKRWALMSACYLSMGAFSSGYGDNAANCIALASMLLGVYLYLKWKNEAKEKD